VLANDQLKAVAAVARAAGAAIMEIYRRDITVEMKGDDSPLTQADLASHEVINKRLLQHFPDIPILSEEGATIPFGERKQWQRFWLVDPLDGTKEFIKRNGEFTVNIALIEQGRPVVGVVFVPALDTMYAGAVGHGAWRQQGESDFVSISARKCSLSAPLVVVQSRSHPSPDVDQFLRNLTVQEAISVGSSLKFCVVAEGRADLYPRLGPTMEWDTAAGHAVVQSAGGIVADISGNELCYNKENLLNSFFIAAGEVESMEGLWLK
jgi:3'(2'), 5'-bisphosphate nucleotidase